MSIHNNRNSAVVTTLSLMAMAVSAIAISTPGYADSHIVRVDANTGITYNSAMSNYRSMDESEKSDWKQANDKVGEIGGWRTYASEAFQANKRLEEEQLNSEGSVEATMEKSEELNEPITSATGEDTADSTVAENKATTTSSSATQAAMELQHKSATALYRGYKEVTLQDWKAANDRVGEIGGWRTYAREAFLANQRLAEEAGENQ